MSLTKDEIVKMAREAGAIISPQWGVASNVGTATFERFATLCRAPLVAENAALKQEQTSAVPVVEQLVEALDGLFSGDVVVWSLGGSARPRAAIAAGRQYLKENGK